MKPKSRRILSVVFGINGVIHAEIVRITRKLRNWTVPRAAIMQVSINTFLQHIHRININSALFGN